MTVEITYKDIPFLIEGTYDEGTPAIFDEAPVPPSFYIENIYIADSQINIKNLTSRSDDEEIEQLIINKINE